MRWLAVWTMVACAPKVDANRAPDAEEPASSAASAPSLAPVDPAAPAADDARARLVRALSIRDPAPSCEVVEGLAGPDPVAELVWVAENVESPPWAGIRAASCVSDRHAGVAGDAVDRWLTDARFPGLARVVIGAFDRMPEDVAVRFGRRALEGTQADAAKSALGRSQRSALRALVTP